MAKQPRRPDGEDIRFDDEEFNPRLEPRSSYAWLNLLEESEDAYEDWNTRCDNIEKQFANIERLNNPSREREFQLFWANCEVLKPSIYARAPIPVVVPKFKDRRPVYQEASEVLERCATVCFDLAYINELMLQVRDDLALIGRGVPWCRYESGDGYGDYSGERVCIDYKHRRDFLHSVSRCWYEVTWVAAASYLTRSEAHERFYQHSGRAYQDAEYRVDKDAKEVGGADNRERAKFWEIWHKTERRVVWVAKGCEDILDEDEPHLDLECFFPCPKPAYGTLQRGSLVPVPDMMQYKDQLEEVNQLTGRIHALADALEVKGFYPAGGGEIADAVQSAIAIKTPGRILVPISNWAAFGGSKEVIIWLPIDQIALTIKELVALRKQLIEDVYQIMGLSDIMRGATDPDETLGAQKLKSDYGSVRTRDKQYELQRIAKDLVCICCEIMTQKFANTTLIEMSQSQLPTQQIQQMKIQQLRQQVVMAQQAMQQMQMQRMQLPPPQPDAQAPGQSPGQPADPTAQPMQQIQTWMQQAQAKIEQIQQEPTIEQVLTFLKDTRAKAFVLDIETDSTILPDEMREKETHTEFLQTLAGTIQQLSQLIAMDPQSAEFCGEVLKFAVKPYRVGRSLDSSIDDYVEHVKSRGQQTREDPNTITAKTALQIEQIKTNRQAERDKADVQLKAQEIAMKDKQENAKIISNERIKMAEIRGRQEDDAARAQLTNQKAMYDREQHQADMIGKAADMQLANQKMAMTQAAHQAKQADMASRASERQSAQAFRQSQQAQTRTPFGGP
jgi:hypothetical protein